jgi:hypothetical protein
MVQAKTLAVAHNVVPIIQGGEFCRVSMRE